jgi:hypothetical protein
MTYWQSTDERQREIAAALDQLVRDALTRPGRSPRADNRRRTDTQAEERLVKIINTMADMPTEQAIRGSGAKRARTADPLLAKDVAAQA